MAKIIGWKAAAEYVGGGVSTMRIRRDVEKGYLHAEKTPSGWAFAEEELARYAAALRAPAEPASAEPAPESAPAPLGADPKPPFWALDPRLDPDTLRAHLASVQQQLASLQQQLAQTMAAWARAHAAAIAGAVAVESLHGTRLFGEVLAVRDAAYAAVAALDPRLLANTQYAYTVAWHAAHAAQFASTRVFPRTGHAN